MNAPTGHTADRQIAIGFLLIENFSLLSYATAVEPLRAANTLAGRMLYRWVHFSVEGEPVRASNGTSILSDYKVGQLPPIDRLFICAGGNPASFQHGPTFRWLKQLRRKGIPICGISGGPYLLARAGLLDGYTFTIHWEHAPALSEDFPDLKPTRGLYSIDRDILTCGGGLSALDMLHEIIKGDFGAPLANAVSRWFLQTEIRPGNSPQLFEGPSSLAGINPKLKMLFEYIEDNLEEPLCRRELAVKAGISVRQLDRLFDAAVNMTVRAYCLAARLDRAQKLLLQTNLSMLDVAVACGFQSASHFTRAYKRQFGRPPRLERQVRSTEFLKRR